MANGVGERPRRAGRNVFIDLLRGIVIVDMMLVHFAPFFWRPLAKALDYTDFAMEGFLLISGYVTAAHYLPMFRERPTAASAALATRALKLIVVHWFLVLTISLPHFLVVVSGAFNDAREFVTQSLVFRNQVGLMHMLPLFAALSLICPVLLWLASWQTPLAIVTASALAFYVGTVYPDRLAWGEPAIFPMALWQVFFVAGVLAGMRKVPDDSSPSTGAWCLSSAGMQLLIAVGCRLAIAAALAVVPRTVSAGRFPLTAAGLVVSLSNISVVLTAARCVWPAFLESSAARVLSKFGRHSLMVFALHVYLFKSIQMALHASGAGGGVAIGAIVASFVVTAAALDWYEIRATSQTGPSLRALRFLFG